eukprot:1739254-Rhodomonas_salina.1
MLACGMEREGGRMWHGQREEGCLSHRERGGWGRKWAGERETEGLLTEHRSCSGRSMPWGECSPRWSGTRGAWMRCRGGGRRTRSSSTSRSLMTSDM